MLVTAGVVAAIYSGSRFVEAARENLLELTTIAAASIHPADFQVLTASVDDLRQPEYRHLKSAMTGIRAEIENTRFAYLVGLRDGQVVFFVDSEPPESPDYSPPGDVYHEAPKELIQAFADRSFFTVGPYTDRWGTWISSYAPVIDQETNELTAYLGVDISQDYLKGGVLYQRTVVIIGTLLLAALLLLSYQLKDRRIEYLASIRYESEKLKKILKHLPVGIVMADAASRAVSFINPKALELLGHQPLNTLLHGSNDFEACLFRDSNDTPLPAGETPMLKTFVTRTAVEKAAICLKRPNGSRVTLQATTLPIFDGGNLVSVLMALEDVTKEKELERMKSEFVRTVSHQLHTPATAIRWLSEILLEDHEKTLTAEQKESLRQIHEGNQRMIDLVSDLLDIARIEAGKGLAIAKTSSDLAPVVEALLEELKPIVRERRLRITKTAFPKHLPATFDPVKIKHVFQNLLENAIKYSRDGGGIVLACDSRDAARYRFSVQDEGIGIPAEEQSRVFDSFYRASNARLIAKSGSGLGLSIAKVIVESHGGKIWFESKEGHGTTFFFTLPRT